MKLIRWAAVAALMGAACAGPAPTPEESPEGSISFLTAGEVVLSLQVTRIADEPAGRARGLMGVAEVSEEEAMVFLFDPPQRSGFWMKDVLVPLDIAWWDEQMRIVEVTTMPLCERDPCPIHEPGAEYTGAVETAAGVLTGPVVVGAEVALDLLT